MRKRRGGESIVLFAVLVASVSIGSGHSDVPGPRRQSSVTRSLMELPDENNTTSRGLPSLSSLEDASLTANRTDIQPPADAVVAESSTGSTPQTWNSSNLFARGYEWGRRGAGRGSDGIRIPSVGHARRKDDKYYLVFTCIVKREKRYLEEWIEYGRLMGVDHFYVYLNECDEPDKGNVSRPVLAPYEEKGWTTVVKWCRAPPLQVPAYNDALKRFGKHTTWMAFVDVDEYVAPQGGILSGRDPVTTLLPQFEMYGGVYVHWLAYGANGHVRMPNASTLVSYTSRLPSNHTKHGAGKSFIRPGRAIFKDSIHLPRFYRPYHVVDTDHVPLKRSRLTMEDKFQRITHTMMAINHYHTRSKEEYVAKALRGSAHTRSSYWPEALVGGDVIDTSVLDYVKQRLNWLRMRDPLEAGRLHAILLFDGRTEVPSSHDTPEVRSIPTVPGLPLRTKVLKLLPQNQSKLIMGARKYELIRRRMAKFQRRRGYPRSRSSVSMTRRNRWMRAKRSHRLQRAQSTRTRHS